MISRTGPWGICTRGRVAPRCATTGVVIHTLQSNAVTSNQRTDFLPPSFMRGSSSSKPRERAGTLPDTLSLDTEQMQNAEQHIRRFLRIVRKNNVAVSLERAVDSDRQESRAPSHAHGDANCPCCFPCRSGCDRARCRRLRACSSAFRRMRQVLHVIAIHLGIVGDVLRLVAVVRRSVPSAIETAIRGSWSPKIAAEHEGRGASDIAFEG